MNGFADNFVLFFNHKNKTRAMNSILRRNKQPSTTDISNHRSRSRTKIHFLSKMTVLLAVIFCVNNVFLLWAFRNFQKSSHRDSRKSALVHPMEVTLDHRSEMNAKETDKNCTSYFPWQDYSYPTCNSIHEIDVGHSVHLFITQGGFRSVWRLTLSEGERVALKTIIFKKNGLFNLDIMQNQRLDALISEKLTSSEHVLNIYQYCKVWAWNSFVEHITDSHFITGGYSGIYEFGNDGNLEDNYHHLNQQERVKISFEIAKGIADLHGLIRDYPIIHCK